MNETIAMARAAIPAMARAAIPLPKYRCHKEVWALKIRAVDNMVLHFENERYAPLDVGEPFIDRHQPKAGGYYVVYQDGYISFSPAEAFEDGYTLIP